jgi:hypothetical protein
MNWKTTPENEAALDLLVEAACKQEPREHVASYALEFASVCGWSPPSEKVEHNDLDWLFQEADKLQTEFEKLRAVGQASMDCDECGGSGSVSGGSLGSCCPTCDGSGVVDAPFSESLGLPDMALFRHALRKAEETLALGGQVDLTALRAELEGFRRVGQEQVKQLREAEVETKRLRGAPRAGRRRRLVSPKEHPIDTVMGELSTGYDEDSDEEE